MKFLVDESTGKKAAEHLEEEHDVIYVADTNRGADDQKVLQESVDEERILITNDKDFGELVFVEKMDYSGIMLLRPKIDTPENRIAIIEEVIDKYEAELADQFIIAAEDKVRIRDL